MMHNLFHNSYLFRSISWSDNYVGLLPLVFCKYFNVQLKKRWKALLLSTHNFLVAELQKTESDLFWFYISLTFSHYEFLAFYLDFCLFDQLSVLKSRFFITFLIYVIHFFPFLLKIPIKHFFGLRSYTIVPTYWYHLRDCIFHLSSDSGPFFPLSPIFSLFSISLPEWCESFVLENRVLFFSIHASRAINIKIVCINVKIVLSLLYTYL